MPGADRFHPGPAGARHHRHRGRTRPWAAYRLRTLNGSNQLQSLFLYGGGLLSFGPAAATSRLYPHADALGNVRFVTNANGALVARYAYDPFGNVRAKEGIPASPFTFASEQADAETGLTFLRARYYDPSVGRFIARDPLIGPLSLPHSQNPYAYALSNPVNFADPSGEFAVGVCGAGNIGVLGFGTCSVCIAVTTAKEVGITASLGGGATTGIATGIGGQVFFSTAKTMENLAGVDVFSGVSAWVGGADVTVSKDDWGGSAGFSFGPDASPPFIPGEFHGGATNTWQWTFYP